VAHSRINRGEGRTVDISRKVLTWGDVLERVTGIEPALSAWEADVLPLNYTRVRGHPRSYSTQVKPRI
jgi:hypothetical protein